MILYQEYMYINVHLVIPIDRSQTKDGSSILYIYLNISLKVKVSLSIYKHSIRNFFLKN